MTRFLCVIAVSLFCFGCSHTHTHDFWDLTHEEETFIEKDPHVLLEILLNANRGHWIKAAIRRGADVREAFKEADIIYSALLPEPNVQVISEFTTEGFEHYRKYKEDWDKTMEEKKRERERWKQEQENKQ